jgi:flagellar secretion chaperone FliS
MTTAAALRSRYLREAASTAPPSRLVTMLYDRLVRDLVLAEVALGAGDVPAVHNELMHAQSIVAELSSSLDLTRWSGAAGLNAIYSWLLDELAAANMAKDASKITGCREVVEPLRDAWHEAAALMAAGS